MIGLINSAGMSDLARGFAIQQATRRVPGGIFVPVQRTDDLLGFRVLRSAIERTEFSGSSAERKAPDGEDSDRFAQTESEARSPTAGPGQVVDTTA